MTHPTLADSLEAGAVERKCGTCEWWAVNLFAEPYMQEPICCADVAMDMPASWSRHNRMDAHEGRDCPIWSADTEATNV